MVEVVPEHSQAVGKRPFSKRRSTLEHHACRFTARVGINNMDSPILSHEIEYVIVYKE
jgi:hypothetical protein